MTTLKHLVNTLTGKTKVAMQYPEEKWDSHLPLVLSRRARAGGRRTRP